MHDRVRTGAQEGFALVEVLVSLALMALIAVLLVETVRSTGRITAAIAAAEGTGQVEAVRDHLRRTFGSLASRHMDGSLPVFQGGPDVLSAVIAPDQSLERPIEIIASLVSASRTDGSADLVERRLPLETLTGSTTIAQSEVLLARVTSLSLRYYGAPTKGSPPMWLPAWSRPDRNPDLVEVQITFRSGDRRRWLPLVVATGEGP